MFQVYKVIQLDRAGIAPTIAQYRKFRVAAVEPRNFGSEPRWSPNCAQVRVALRATDVGRDREPQMTAMF
jgi:hypothetical protein